MYNLSDEELKIIKRLVDKELVEGNDEKELEILSKINLSINKKLFPESN